MTSIVSLGGKLWASAILLILAMYSVTADGASKSKDCNLKQYASIDLVISDQVFVPVELEGTSGLMMLNLGSGLSLIREGVVRDWGLVRHKLDRNAHVEFGSSVITEFVEFNSLVIGHAAFKGKFLVAPEPERLHPAAKLTIGALGMEIFSNVDFELDLAHRKLNLFSQDHCPGDVVYWANEFASTPLYRGPIGSLYFPIELDGKKVEATISPSNELTTLRTDITKSLYGFDQNSPDIEITWDENSGKAQAHYRAMALTAPGLAVTNARIKLLPADGHCRPQLHGRKGGAAGYSECMGVHPMSIGRNVLEKLRLYFATKENVLYFTTADAAK